MQPMTEHWAGNTGEWIEGISWKTKDRIYRSMPGYHGMLLCPIVYARKYPTLPTSQRVQSPRWRTLISYVNYTEPHCGLAEAVVCVDIGFGVLRYYA